MRKIILTLCAVLVSVVSFGQGLNDKGDNIIGTYLTDRGGSKSKVRVTKNADGTYDARVFWVENALDENGKGYMLLFRDCTDSDNFTFENVLTDGTSLELMYSNFEVKANKNGKDVEFCAEKQRTFALYKIK